MKRTSKTHEGRSETFRVQGLVFFGVASIAARFLVKKRVFGAVSGGTPLETFFFP